MALLIDRDLGTPALAARSHPSDDTHGAQTPDRIALEDVTVSYGAVRALDRVSMTVRRGEILCLVGPSGSGKSTVLRTIAGLERPARGRVLVDRVEMAGPDRFVEPEQRQIGMVFQDCALFPHLTVAANVAFGVRARPRTEVSRIVGTLLERVHLDAHAERYPHMLSGGERQRAALARALAPAPRALLLDEPFSSLDGRLRDEVRRETLALLSDLGATAIFVTHDPAEALSTGDRVALLRDGRVEQCDAPHAIYRRPATRFAARFFGEINDIPGACRDGCLETALGSFAARHLAGRTSGRACIRPQHVRLAKGPTPVAARVVATTFLGEIEEIAVIVSGAGVPVVLRTPGPAGLGPGDFVHLDVRGEDVMVLADEA